MFDQNGRVNQKKENSLFRASAVFINQVMHRFRLSVSF